MPRCIDNIDLDGANPLELVLEATVNQHGSLETNGTLAWAPLVLFIHDTTEIAQLTIFIAIGIAFGAREGAPLFLPRREIN